jgi:hypothetical protein
VPGGRLERGAAVVFPNLFPYDDVSGIAVLCGEHFHPMDAMPERLVVDGLTAARDLTRLVAPRFAGRDASGIVTWTYMPPAGGTQVHPHMQVVVTTTAGNAVGRMLAASDAAAARTGRAFSRISSKPSAAARVGSAPGASPGCAVRPDRGARRCDGDLPRPFDDRRARRWRHRRFAATLPDPRRLLPPAACGAST